VKVNGKLARDPLPAAADKSAIDRPRSPTPTWQKFVRASGQARDLWPGKLVNVVV